ncbi:MAG: plasmid pRiA4b ORF-3 family protein [Bacteroidetes bacterium]|nr:plasmid pRiA4b ORF-3 family protein [Bacteroidota bacterium]
MAILKFRVFLEEDDTVYRDIALKHTQTFYELHQSILKGYEFDSIHEAIFFRSNDLWQRGRAISLEKYEGVEYKVEPLDMIDTIIGSEIKDTEQKFIYVYDLKKNWTFHIQLINVSKEENPKLTYPAITRKEGIGPSQYGIKSILGDKFADIEEKYDLSAIGEGFTDEGEDEGEQDDELGSEETGGEDENTF